MKVLSSTAARVTTFGIAALMAACGHEPGEPATLPIDPIAYDAVFVVNGTDNSITVIDTTTDEVRGTIELLEVEYPHHIYLSADRGTLLVAVPGSDLSAGHGGGGGHGGAPAGAVLALEATTGALRVARRLPSPNHNAVFAPDGRVWTSQISSPGKVLILDPTDLETSTEVMVDDGPAEVTFARSGAHGFVANTDSDSVTILDAATGAVVETLPVGDAPVGAWPGTDGRMYVDNEAGKSISVIDPSTRSIVGTFALGFTPALAAIAPGGELWVTDTDSGRLVFFDAATGTKRGELATGGGAHAITFTADGAKAYVSNQAADTVTAIDVATKRVVKTISVGAKPNGLVFRKN